MKKLFNFIRSIALLPHTNAFANVAVGTHEGRITRKLSAAVTERYTLVKSGALQDTAEPCSAGDRPLGVATDTGAAGERININLPANSAQTQLVVAASAIAEGDKLYAAANGRVQRLPNVAGSYFEIGTALTSASAAGELVEVTTHAVRQVINVSAFTGNTANDLSKLAVAFEQAPDKIRLLAL